MQQFRFMACFAHPDDEAFSSAGTMALHKRRGITNTLICATRGEAGEISDPALATPENLGAVRTEELKRAAEIMGVDALHFLGYRDSGMADTPENDHPNAYAQAKADEVVPRLVTLMRETRPHVLLTFDPNGGYGHPDHIAIHKHAVAAFHAAADPTYRPDLGEPWQASRLFYPALDKDLFKAIAEQLEAQGHEAPDWANNDEEDSFWSEQEIHAKVDIQEVFDLKMKALTSHQTQMGPQHPFMQVDREFLRNEFDQEWFELAWPEPDHPSMLSDLFEGL